MQDNFLWKENRVFSKAEAWIDLIMEAQYKKTPKEVLIGNIIFTQNYGESLKSLGTWSKRWNWTKNKTWRFLHMLQDCNMVCIKNEIKTERITIVNYGIYADEQNANRTDLERIQNGLRTDLESNKKDKKEKNNKNVKKEVPSPDPIKKKPLIVSPEDLRLANLLSSLMYQNNPLRKPTAEKQIESWANDCRLMRERDNRSSNDIEEHIKFSQSHHFWKSNILSMDKLRKQYDTLTLQMKKPQTQLDKNVEAMKEFSRDRGDME